MTCAPESMARAYARSLSRVIRRARLAHHDDPHLARIRRFGLDRSRDLFRHHGCLGVVDLIVHHHHADLATGLQRERALDAAEPLADRLEIIEPLDVARELFAA